MKVQLLWTSLESVFMGGDIAKQMPVEAKKFAKIDKDWAKNMLKGVLILAATVYLVPHTDARIQRDCFLLLPANVSV